MEFMNNPQGDGTVFCADLVKGCREGPQKHNKIAIKKIVSFERPRTPTSKSHPKWDTAGPACEER